MGIRKVKNFIIFFYFDLEVFILFVIVYKLEGVDVKGLIVGIVGLIYEFN